MISTPKDRRLTVWISDETYDALAETARHAGLKVGEYARTALLNELNNQKLMRDTLQALVASNVALGDQISQPRQRGANNRGADERNRDRGIDRRRSQAASGNCR